MNETEIDQQATGIRCARCAYDLTGLGADALCPECGTPIERSISGNQLIGSPPEYVSTLVRGSFTILFSIVAQVVIQFGLACLIFFNIWAQSPTLQIGFLYLSSAAYAAGLLGWWWLTAPDPRLQGLSSAGRARRWVRGAVIARAAFWIQLFFVPLVNVLVLSSSKPFRFFSDMMGSFDLFSFAAHAVWFFAAMLYLRWLAQRLPSARVEKRSKLLLWLGPVLIIIGLFTFMIGALIAMILYWTLIFRVWKDLRGIRSRQRRLGALTPGDR